ncbi:MAG TPA: 50S ribosomal protein L25 [Firmicutes bacterium]|jgi:large subunit ribosomal protein L25|nr:50S ribosomal protein L25 [Bacillota bacterium]
MEAILTASIREETGKGIANKLRSAGQLPAVLYGKDNLVITLNTREVQKFLATYGTSQLAQVNLVKGKKSSKRPVLIKEVQVDPVKGDLLHVDLYEVSMDTKVTVSVPIVLVGQEERQNDGALVDQLLYEVEVSCLPTEIPKRIEVDVSKLAMNQSIAVQDITPPKDVEFITALDEVVVTAIPPRVETTETGAKAEAEDEAEAAPAPEA